MAIRAWMPRPQSGMLNLIYKPDNPRKILYTGVKCRTIFRPIPEVKDGKVLPWRTGSGPLDIGNWIQSLPRT